MRTPFVRPFFAGFFYVLAGLSAAFSLLAGIVIVAGGISIFGRSVASILAVYGVSVVIILLLQAAGYAAIGYCIELLAKIEWNTRPAANGMSYGVSAPSSPIFPMTDKQYFLSEKGRVSGPLNAAELLTLYREGKVSNAAQIAVEENGQRRLLKNLSEIGL